MSPGPSSEIGRPLKVSELKEQTIVVLQKHGSKYRHLAVTVWVWEVLPKHVAFLASSTRTTLILARAGADLESLTDSTGLPIAVYEYLGKE